MSVTQASLVGTSMSKKINLQDEVFRSNTKERVPAN